MSAVADVEHSAASRTATGLVLSGVRVDRRGFPVVRDVDLEAPLGEVTVLLGANGAGKTTLLEAVSGLIPLRQGTVTLGGRDLSRASRYRRARHGLCHLEQGRQTFPDLTVQENLEAVGGEDAYEQGCELFPELRARRRVMAGSLSGGEQQMLVVARAMACKPTMILADELSLGLAPVVVKRLLPVVRALADDGIGVLLVEQHAAEALKIGTRAYLLARGALSYAGPAAELLEHPELLRRAYLGLPGPAGNPTEVEDG